MTDFGASAQPNEKTAIRAKMGEILARIPYEKDKVVFREGHDGTDAYVLESGRIGVFKMMDGKPVRLAVLEKGAIFGEMAAITGERRSATTIAMEHCVLVRISKSTIQQKLSSCDPFIKGVIAILINNLSRVNERFATTNKAAEQMLANLKAAQEKQGEEKPVDEKPAEENAPAAGA